MLQDTVRIAKKITRKTFIRHYPGDHVEDLMKREFFNGAFRKSLTLSHESPAREPLLHCITG